METLEALQQDIVSCHRCPRLRTHCANIAQEKRLAYRAETYWGRPVPGFGAPHPRLWIVGLAPGAHGANRTGRVFTGDSSGDWLFSALHRFGFSSQPQSTALGDGLTLLDTYISCICRCAPPENRPLPQEIRACHPFLQREWLLLGEPPLVLALGKLAFDEMTKILVTFFGLPKTQKYLFKHGAQHAIGKSNLLASYHPSRQNTATGRLTLPMWNAIFKEARSFLENHPTRKH